MTFRLTKRGGFILGILLRLRTEGAPIALRAYVCVGVPRDKVSSCVYCSNSLTTYVRGIVDQCLRSVRSIE